MEVHWARSLSPSLGDKLLVGHITCMEKGQDCNDIGSRRVLEAG